MTLNNDIKVLRLIEARRELTEGRTSFLCVAYSSIYGSALFDDIPEIMRYRPIAYLSRTIWFRTNDVQSRLAVIDQTIDYLQAN